MLTAEKTREKKQGLRGMSESPFSVSDSEGEQQVEQIVDKFINFEPSIERGYLLAATPIEVGRALARVKADEEYILTGTSDIRTSEVYLLQAYAARGGHGINRAADVAMGYRRSEMQEQQAEQLGGGFLSRMKNRFQSNNSQPNGMTSGQ